MRIALVFFSGTGVTASITKVVSSGLIERGCTVEVFDVTSFSSRQNRLGFHRFDGAVFGFPVYMDFAPSVVNDWIQTLKGHGKPATMFFTYGARSAGFAHFHTKRLLEAAGFRVCLSAEFPGRHTFNLTGWTILPNRPDASDFAIASEYAVRACRIFRSPSPDILPLQKPSGYNETICLFGGPESKERTLRAIPERTVETCRMCRRCEKECATHAFDAITGKADPTKCIECLHCVYICPDQVLHVDERFGKSFDAFLKGFCLTNEIMEMKRSRIISSPVD